MSIEDKLIILEWRNNLNIRSWMFDSEIIEKKNHLKYISSLEKNIDKKYFLIKKENEKIGVIYFTNIKLNKSAEFGIYSNPYLKGNSHLLMKIILDYAYTNLNLKVLYAEVFTNNEIAIKIYKKNKFLQVCTRNTKGQEIFILERKIQ